MLSVDIVYKIYPIPPIIEKSMTAGNVWNWLIPMNCVASMSRAIETRSFDLIRSFMKPDGITLISPVIVVTAMMIPICVPEKPIEL